MTGRGIDQILPHPGDPTLREAYIDDARTYVELAESAHGPVGAPVDFAWPWGDALDVLANAAPDALVINLETSITRSDDFAARKAPTYRMSPENLPCLTVVRPDACALANNHVLDFGQQGLLETLAELEEAHLRPVGAGRDADEAERPVVIPLSGGGRVLVFSCGLGSSGIPSSWAATSDRPGVNLVEPTATAADRLTASVRAARHTGDVVVMSVHWGSNWGYDIHPAERDFAHRLVDGGVDVVHGHSSHHPRQLERYGGRLILYGCGDFVNDYEGIRGTNEFRSDLRPLYLVTLDDQSGALKRLRLAVLQSHRLRLRRAAEADAAWLAAELTRVSAPWGAELHRGPDGLVNVHPARGEP